MSQQTNQKSLFDLSGKVVVVTGGSRGLGYQMVKAFSEHGADVVIASRKFDACEAVAEEIRAVGRRALAVACHAGKWNEMEALAETVYAEFGRIDVLVNNAGMSPAERSHEVTETLFDKVVGLNFKGPFRLSAVVAQRMAEGEGGSIINVSSTAGMRPVAQIVPYSCAKAALNAMTSALAQEYGPKVRVNTISAGPFLTDISRSWAPEMRETCDNALGRPGRPEEIVTTALYLASDHSSYTTSALIKVDGGLP